MRGSSRPEVLAPVGSPQALEAALAAGADGVYLGIDVLNARRNAQNFTAEDLPALVRKCHVQGTKVYLTLNVLLLETERDELFRAARAAWEAGVDAVIVQDLGVAALLRRWAPQLRLHASTQMGIHNCEGAAMLSQLGFSRVVLARECSRGEIADIVASTDLEVEVFVHGAQCMSVSGQCYMSSLLGQRSGNRGLCAQPCRLSFSTPATEHALSLKDLSLLCHVEELQRLGVYSLKIEGRMKRPEYVAAAVTACFSALKGEPVDMNTLRSVFSRDGFTDGYYNQNRGLQMFGIREKEDVEAADGVLKELANLYNRPVNHVKRVPIDGRLLLRQGEAAMLVISDDDGHEVRAQGEIPQEARSAPTDERRLMDSLGKTGGTPYRLRDCICEGELDPGLMLPMSALNALRREALEELSNLRAVNKPLGRVYDHPFPAEMPTETQSVQGAGGSFSRRRAFRICAAYPEQITDVMLQEAEMIALPLSVLSDLSREGGRLWEHPEKLCAEIPRILFHGQQEVRTALKGLEQKGLQHVQVGNLGALSLALEGEFVIHASPFLNVINSDAVIRLQELGVNDICLSFEIDLKNCIRLTEDSRKRCHRAPRLGVLAYGYLPLMTVRVCPLRVAGLCDACKKGGEQAAFTDRKGNRMRTSCARGCTEVLNPVPLYMADRLRELPMLDFFTLRYTVESPEECQALFEAYCQEAPGKGFFTRGLFYRPLL